MARQRTLVTGGHVISMDPAIGELRTGDVLIEAYLAVPGPRDLRGLDTRRLLNHADRTPEHSGDPWRVTP
jgi:hypothetical protein